MLKSQPPYYHNDLVRYPFFYLIVVHRGKLYFRNHRGQTPIGPGAMVVLRPGDQFQLYTKAAGYSGVAVAKRPGEVEPFRGESLVLATPPEVAEMSAWAERELTAPDDYSRFLASGLGEAMLQWALRRIHEHAPGEPKMAKGRYWSARAAAAIAGALFTDRSIEEILTPLEPSRRQLTRYMKAELDLSPKQYQAKLKMEEAGRLLRISRLSVTSIAMELGYPSVQHFSAQFNKAMGCSPSQWRGGNREG